MMGLLPEIPVMLTTVTVLFGLIGQTGYVALYATRPWRAFRVTRSLMNKSFAFWLWLLYSAARLAVHGPRMVEDPYWLIVFGVCVDVFVLFAIWYQFVALVIEVWRGDNQVLDLS